MTLVESDSVTCGCCKRKKIEGYIEFESKESGTVIQDNDDRVKASSKAFKYSGSNAFIKRAKIEDFVSRVQITPGPGQTRNSPPRSTEKGEKPVEVQVKEIVERSHEEKEKTDKVSTTAAGWGVTSSAQHLRATDNQGVPSPLSAKKEGKFELDYKKIRSQYRNQSVQKDQEQSKQQLLEVIEDDFPEMLHNEHSEANLKKELRSPLRAKSENQQWSSSQSIKKKLPPVMDLTEQDQKTTGGRGHASKGKVGRGARIMEVDAIQEAEDHSDRFAK